jgi:hypothetical protein
VAAAALRPLKSVLWSGRRQQGSGMGQNVGSASTLYLRCRPVPWPSGACSHQPGPSPGRSVPAAPSSLSGPSRGCLAPSQRTRAEPSPGQRATSRQAGRSRNRNSSTCLEIDLKKQAGLARKRPGNRLAWLCGRRRNGLGRRPRLRKP